MTIEALLDCSIDKLESFTTEQLHEWFKPLIPTTRPDLVIKTNSEKKSNTMHHSKQKHLAEQLELNKMWDKVEEIARAKGVDLKLPRGFKK